MSSCVTLASTALVAGEYMHMYIVLWPDTLLPIDSLRKLAFALEEGYTFDEEDPDVNVDMHCLLNNFSIWSKDGNSFLCYTFLKGSLVLKINNLFYFIPNSELLLHFC